MSVSKNEEPVLPRISDFYSKLFEHSWVVFLFSETALVSIVITFFVISSNLFGIEITLILTVLFMIVLQSAVSYFLLLHILKPVDVMALAIARVNGEDSVRTPPDRNDPSFKKSGLNVIIDAIYSDKAPSEAPITKDASDDIRLNLMSSMPVGILALDANRKIIAANSLAPTFLNEKNGVGIQLDFSSVGDSLESWLDSVTDSQISAYKVWPRIANVEPGSPADRKIFDIVAHYVKNSPNGIETVILAIDRTDEYADEEINLDFIALAAHELRGPITVIRGYLDILDEQLNDQLTQEQHALIERLDVSAKRLSSYVNNILNASRYDRKHLQLTLRETSVDNIVGDIKDDMELRAKTLNRTLVWQVPHNIPTVASDQSSVSEVISNLIDNAIKYSHEGGVIEICAFADNQFVSISVKDHGMGIPANIASNLFSKFYRSHRSRGTISGTGLGLYISRAIIESHGGSIGVESQEGVGSTFTFTLPIFASVSANLSTKEAGNNTELIRKGGNWIRNHSRVKE